MIELLQELLWAYGPCGDEDAVDRALLVVLLSAARELWEREQRPPQDVYFVCTVSEEVGGLGGSYASRALPGELTLALEVGPTEAEYGTTVTGGPIVGYGDVQCIYDKAVADRLMEVATALGADPQPGVLGAFESDASHAKSNGYAAAAGLLCLPTLSTHGYEVVPRAGIGTLSAVLAEFLANPVPFVVSSSWVNRATPGKDAS
jgi:putative aminopeptidase FrvX